MQQQSPNISYDLSKGSQTHREQVCPCLISDAEVDIEDQTNGEEGKKEGIGGYIWIISIDRVLNRAFH